MPYLEPDETDPSVLVGVMMPSDPSCLVEMAYTFAEEYALLGHDKAEIMRIFRAHDYVTAHDLMTKLGASEVERIVDECIAVFGRVRITIIDSPETDLVQIGGLLGRPVPAMAEE